MNTIFSKIAAFKKKSFNTVIIESSYQNEPYELIFLTHDIVANDEILTLLSNWRARYQDLFQAQFPVSLERTRGWFQKRVVDEPDRLLFLIRQNHRYIGHVGLYRFDVEKKIADIDNVIRGIDDAPKGIMTQALQDLMEWGRDTLRLRTYTVETTSDNPKAIALYERLGFRKRKEVPLLYKKTKEGGEWVEAPTTYSGKIVRKNVFFTL